MKKELPLSYRFFQYNELNFVSCFSAVFMYMNGVNNTDLEKTFFLFEAVTGRSNLRHSYSGEPTPMETEINGSFDSDETIDFIAGFGGFAYHRVGDGFKRHIEDSINANRPVIARMKDGSRGGFRVITGYDGEGLLIPDAKVDKPPERAPSYDEIESLYVFGEKIPQRYTFLDCLKRIERVLDYNFTQGIWLDFIHKFDHGCGGIWETPVSEMKHRFARLADAAWYATCISHAFQQGFEDIPLQRLLGMDDGRLHSFYHIVGSATDTIHNRGYQAKAQYDGIRWETLNPAEAWPWHGIGYVLAAEQALESILDCDYRMLIATKTAIRRLSE